MSMTVSQAWNSAVTYSSDSESRVMPTDAQLATIPPELNPDIFQAWSRQGQLRYLELNGFSVGQTAVIGPIGNTITASVIAQGALSYSDPASNTYAADNDGRRATATELSIPPASLDPRVFLAWALEDRTAYVRSYGGAAIGSIVSIGQNAGVGILEVSLVPDVKTTGHTVFGTPGDLQPIPYHHLPGSSSGSDGAIVKASAEALFPSLNGTTSRLSFEGRPDGFGTSNTSANAATLAAQFVDWHTAYQLEYIAQNSTNGILNIPPTGTALVTAVTSATEPGKVYIVQDLQKADFSKMSKADQDRIAGTPAFAALAARLGLSTIGASTVSSVVNAGTTTTAATAIQQVIDQINSKNTTNRSPTGLMPQADRQAFTRQLDILKTQIDGMGVLSPADVQTKIAAIKERFDRAFAFYDVRASRVTERVTSDNPEGVFADRYRDVVSTDNIATINKGYAVFIAQEKRIADLAQARMQIAQSTGSGRGQDVPSLVYQFQSLYNLSLEAEVIIETEEINQQNDLLKTYARMQDIVNQTLSSFEKVDEGKKGIGGRGVDDYFNYFPNSAESRAAIQVISMFEDLDGNGQKHPLETLRGINRPLQEMFEQKNNNNDSNNYDLVQFTHATWSSFGNRLSEAVTIINQNSQLKMNDVNSLDKQRNRHFELANGALSKAAEIIGAIARS